MEGPGFLLTFDTFACCNGDGDSGVCKSGCTTYTYPNGLITSPGYPNSYPNDEIHGYTVTQANNTFINITFQRMDIEGDNSCQWDYLEIRDGRSEKAPLLGKLCGNDIPATIQSTQNHVWMR